jgi:hypothetical protein
MSSNHHTYIPHFTHHLTQNHAHRMDASQILKHPFITDDPTLPNAQPSFKIPGTFGTSHSEKAERTSAYGPSLDPPCQASTRDQIGNNRSRPLPTLAMHLNRLDRRQVILGDISNIDMRKPTLRDCSLPSRRVFSDPVSLKTPYCITEEKPTNSDSPMNLDTPENKENSVLINGVLPRTYDIALPYQNSIPLDGKQLPMKPLKFSNNLNKTHNILPSVSHAYCYREIYFYWSSRAQRTISLRYLLEQLAHSQ